MLDRKKLALPIVALAVLVIAVVIVAIVVTESNDPDHAPSPPGIVAPPLFEASTIRDASLRVVAESTSASVTDRSALEPTLATIVLLVEEIDRCIDPRGSTLSIRDRGTGNAHLCTLGEDGAAIFESVAMDARGSTFEILTGVADRRCFPASFAVSPEDLAGEPPSFALSVALVHDHALEGRVLDAATRRPIESATVEIDSFAVSSATSDADGRYYLSLPDPRGTLWIRAPGYQELLWAFPKIRADGSTWLPSEQDFELIGDPLTSWIEIEAFFSDGTPARNASIRVNVGSDVAYADALVGFSDVALRDRYLENLEKELAGIGRVRTLDGSTPSNLDENGRATLCVVLPCAVEIQVGLREELALKQIVLAPRSREKVRLDLSPEAVLDIGVVGVDSIVAGTIVLVDSTGFPLLSCPLGLSERVELAEVPPVTDLTVYAIYIAREGSQQVHGFASRRLTTGSSQVPLRVDLVHELVPAELPLAAKPQDLRVARPIDLTVSIEHDSGGILQDEIAVDHRSWSHHDTGHATRDATGRLAFTFEAQSELGWVSARRGLIGDTARVSTPSRSLAVRPLRRIRVFAFDRVSGAPLAASVYGVTASRSDEFYETFVPCGKTVEVVVEAPGHRSVVVPIGDADGLPWLRVPMDP